MNFNSTLGIISTFTIFLPAIFIVVFQLFTHRAFLALLIYYVLTGSYNLIAQKLIPASPDFYFAWGIINNLLDAPLLLLFLTFFSATAIIKKSIYITLFVFLIFEMIVIAVKGFNVPALKIILGPDIAIVVAYSFIFFLKNVRLAITNHKNLGKAFMASSLFFAYSIFSLVYVYYYLLNNPDRSGTALVYYLICFLSAIVMSVGIFIETKRIKKLNELKHTRKELAAIYGSTEPA